MRPPAWRPPPTSRASSRPTSAIALDILADILQIPRYAQEELEREREVILQEIAATRDSPDEIAYELLQDAAFPDQAIGRPILGTTKSVDALHRRRPAHVPEANYGASRMVLSAAGNVDHAALVRHAEALFGGMNGGVGGRIRAGALCGWHAHSAKPFEQSHLVMAFAGPVYRRRGVLYSPGVFGAVRRGHVVSPVSGSAGAPRPLLCDLFELLGAGRHGPFRYPCRDRSRR